MKKTLIALTLVLLSVGIFAAQRSVNEAAAIAAQVNNHAWHKISKQFVSAAPQEAPSVRLVRTQNQPLSDKAAFYVFDREDQGFVIVSADDNTRDILAYSNQGSFPKQVPANVQFLLDYMAERIAYTSQIGKAADATSFYTPVTPLLDGIQWDQGEPYQDKCPIEKNGNQTVTGCVATATAQVMRYWKWPTKGTGSHSYTIDNVDGILSANFGATTYDWANMPKTTSGYTTSEQKDAVATLMYHIGVAVEMDYSSSGSGASCSDVATALVNYFGYKNTLEYVNTYDMFSGNIWESSYKTARRMREDLAKGHPIIVGGSDASSSGHAFVFEGYDENGLFYVNWGWGGSYNGYYAIDYLEPGGSGIGGNGAGYSNYLCYIIGIEPNGSVTPPTPSTPETISGLQNGEACYRAHNGSQVWYIDLYKGYNNDHIYPELEFSINAKSKTSLSGTYNLLNVKYTTTTRKVIQCYNGRVTISLAQTGKYNIEGTFYGDDGKTYTFDQAIAISACDLDNNRAEITLVEPTEPIVKTCTEAAAIALALPENNVPTVEVYSITGYVTNVVSDVSNGQQTFWMDDENGIKKTFEGYGCNLPAKDQKTLNVGDLVKIVGPIMKDNATPEMKNGDITIIDRVDAPRDTLYFSYLGINIYECTNWETGVQTGWFYILVDASTGYQFILESTVVDEKYGTFSYADKTLGRNCINIYSPDNNELQFVEGSITVSDVGGIIVLDGELIAGDGKVYVLHFVQPVDVKFENNGLWYEILTMGETNTVKVIGHTNYKNLQTANIPNSISHAGIIFDVVEIGGDAFNGCSGLTSITIPNSVTTIGYFAFYGCSGLTSVTIPNSVTTIGVLAFYECVGLTSVTIGNSVTEIGEFAFAWCENLTSIVIPNSVTTIGEYAFEVCSGLTSLTIGSSVATIGERAFLACNVLTSIICYAVTPPECGDDVFEYISQDAKVYVPASALTDYQSAKVWKDMLLLPIAADVTPMDDENPIVIPTDQDVTITWPITDGADTYTLIVSKNGKVVCTLTFNANGQLTNIAFAAPGHNGSRHAPAATLTEQGFLFTVTGLDPGTAYEYSVTTTNAEGQTIAEHKGNFSTTGGGTPTSINEVHGSQCPMRKFFHNGNLIIERNGIKYTATGQKVK